MKNKTIQIIIIIGAIVLAVILMLAIVSKKTKNPPVLNENKISENNEQDRKQLEIQKKIETENIKLGVRAVVDSIGKETLNVTTLDGKELELKILPDKILDSVKSTDGPVEIDSKGNAVKKGTVFMKKNGDTLEEIKDFKLEKISQGQEIGIVYMTLSKEAVQITVE
ncbi:MAG: hypothetical protein US30_C0004G0054 [Candidatus Moranbacteria bacterium GW2011_GWF2_36_839]|nr:MAG: hypothetical protein US27_C0002G0057 [Candidatus Moranbacteria bacterium GW2011_GWF1_36_78]KKQ17310.1 MAG: hypothetical protein US30_C0004G0054 [Candidatus Moranbacteria bacterium GW2011_GWF2_36_839]HAT73845.1 hypothetical protein [Candidatus Moranbacteria bacterium]HBY11012.1 hypothetical protein [Candidatus Moranbacteria bacterium]